MGSRWSQELVGEITCEKQETLTLIKAPPAVQRPWNPHWKPRPSGSADGRKLLTGWSPLVSHSFLCGVCFRDFLYFRRFDRQFVPRMLYGLLGISMLISTARPDNPLQKKFPTAIIVGVKKAGTRALLEFLRLNPRIRAPGPEVHFFDKNYHRGLEWYREAMPLTNDDQLTIEKSPAYFHSKFAAERIRALNPAMKIIIVVRNPVMRAISDYTQASSKRKNFGGMPTFEEMAVGDCAPWLKTNCSSKVGGVNVGWGAIRIGVYHKHMKRWLDNFPMEQIHIVDGERLVTQPALEVSQTERFLGLEPVVKPENFGVDPVKKFPCVRRADGSLHCLGKTKGRKHPLIQTEVLQRLRRFYEPENRKFFRMVNRSFMW
ncbi:hypothetical protein Y032_0006g3044 [Ancylostoma ceylanicum]|uniref:Sulfotransferase domain-containing protein n=1 Tax=Ancylostoma ceylanicum TaxID=53326 RepID=A0A016VQK2_9BILA|nr:hypothetical protein Y032_0006g3044 [Ancylostoma ceylanicum]